MLVGSKSLKLIFNALVEMARAYERVDQAGCSTASIFRCATAGQFLTFTTRAFHKIQKISTAMNRSAIDGGIWIL
jgi:hypothetical protein